MTEEKLELLLKIEELKRYGFSPHKSVDINTSQEELRYVLSRLEKQKDITTTEHQIDQMTEVVLHLLDDKFGDVSGTSDVALSTWIAAQLTKKRNREFP
jgi:hypothetical protein